MLGGCGAGVVVDERLNVDCELGDGVELASCNTAQLLQLCEESGFPFIVTGSVETGDSTAVMLTHLVDSCCRRSV